MDSSGHLVVLEYSDGTKRVHADVAIAPTELRKEVSDAVADEIDVDAIGNGDIVAEVFFEDLLGDASVECELEEWAREAGEDA